MVHFVDAREGRPFVTPTKKDGKGVSRTEALGLYIAIGEITHPASDAKVLGLILRRPAKPDALHATPNM